MVARRRWWWARLLGGAGFLAAAGLLCTPLVPALAAEVEEVFTIRDVIANNHLWECRVTWNAEGAMVFAEFPRLLPGYGNRRFAKVIDPRTRCSRRLGLNLFPTRVWRRDAWRVLGTLYRALCVLEKDDPGGFSTTATPFEFHGQSTTFADALERFVQSASK